MLSCLITQWMCNTASPILRQGKDMHSYIDLFSLCYLSDYTSDGSLNQVSGSPTWPLQLYWYEGIRRCSLSVYFVFQSHWYDQWQICRCCRGQFIICTRVSEYFAKTVYKKKNTFFFSLMLLIIAYTWNIIQKICLISFSFKPLFVKLPAFYRSNIFPKFPALFHNWMSNISQARSWSSFICICIVDGVRLRRGSLASVTRSLSSIAYGIDNAIQHYFFS